MYHAERAASTVQIQPIDANTVQTPQGIAKRIAP